nr:MAG TPA: hypothetical protein [Caudoviricetes sp.]
MRRVFLIYLFSQVLLLLCKIKKREFPLYDLHLPCRRYNIIIFHKIARLFIFF